MNQPTPEDLIKQAARLLERASEVSKQYTEADLKTMTPRQIVEARENGQLDDILRRK